MPVSQPPAGSRALLDAWEAYHRIHTFLQTVPRTGAGDLFERRFLLAGQRLHLRVFGRELGELLYAPFAHLPSWNGHGTDLSIQAFDYGRYPSPCALEYALVPEALMEGLTIPSEDGRHIVHVPNHSNSVWALDRARGSIVGSVAPPASLSIFERGKPLLPMLEFWFGEGPCQVLHAGLVSAAGCGILFAGPNGAGKSTCSLCCLRGGLDYLGDDRVVLEASEHGFLGHSMYGVTWMDPLHLRRFPDVLAKAVADERWADPKRIVFLSRLYPGKLPPTVPITNVVLPRVRGVGPSFVRPATRGDAVRALAASCVLTGPRLGQAGLRLMTKLVEACQCHWLELGDDLGAVAGCVAAIAGARA